MPTISRIAATVAAPMDRLRDGAILRLHDGRGLDPPPDASQVATALPDLLRAARTRGFRLLTLSTLLAETGRRRWPDPARG